MDINVLFFVPTGHSFSLGWLQYCGWINSTGMLIGLTKEELPLIHVVWLYHVETSDIYGKNVSWYCGNCMYVSEEADWVLLMMCLLGCCGLQHLWRLRSKSVSVSRTTESSLSSSSSWNLSIQEWLKAWTNPLYCDAIETSDFYFMSWYVGILLRKI
jgi:hypothetical protein